MKVIIGAVIIWVGDTGKYFEDIPKADKYFARQERAGKNPRWQRLIEEGRG